MNIKVWTKQPNTFIRKVRAYLHERGIEPSATAALLDGQFDGEVVSWKNLSTRQFCALEDMSVRMGLEYDGRQEL